MGAASTKPAAFEDVGKYTKEGLPIGVLMMQLRLANVYLADGILVDAGTKWDFTVLCQALGLIGQAGVPSGEERISMNPIMAHAITHAHPDHQGSSAAICQKFKVPFLCGEHDRAVAEGRARMAVGPRYHPFHWLPHNTWSGTGHPVTQGLKDGDRIGQTGSVHVIETPGHTLGSISFWIPQSGVAIVGDLLANNAWFQLGSYRIPPCPRHPPTRFNAADRATNRASLDKVLSLGPRMLCFGHGPPLILDESVVEIKSDDSLPALAGAAVGSTVTRSRCDTSDR